MEKILIERYEDDPEALGCVRAEGGSWEVIVDKENIPHLYVETNVETDDGEVIKGMLCIEDMLPDFTIKEIMLSTFGGKLSPSEEAEAIQEYRASREKTGIPCHSHGGARGKKAAA